MGAGGKGHYPDANPPTPPTVESCLREQGREVEEGGEGEGGGTGKPDPEDNSPEKRSHRQQKGEFRLSQHPLSHKVTDSERSLAE